MQGYWYNSGVFQRLSQVQHEVSRSHRQRAVRYVVLSDGTTMFHGILETKTKEQATVDPSLF